MKQKNSKGITLIALVITIIVLLILAGVTIDTLTGENGILIQAERAKDETEKEVALEKVDVEVLRSYAKNGNLDKDLLKNNLKNINGIEAVPDVIDDTSFPLIVTVDGVKVLINADGSTMVVEIPEGLSIGDTITYTPEDETYPWPAVYSGDSNDNTLDNTSNDYKITNWKVFNINKDGTVELIAAKQTTGKAYLGNAQGYNNAVKLLNDACDKLYGNNTKGITGRSINIEDIEGKMTEEALNEAHKYNNGYATYGEQKDSPFTANKQYPSIYAQENLSVIDENTNTKGLKMSEQTAFVGATDGGATNGIISNATSIQPYQRYWTIDANDMLNIFEGEVYNLIMPQGTSTTAYWLASRSVTNYSNGCNFGIRTAGSGRVATCDVYTSYNQPTSGSCTIMPIISLKSSIIKGSDAEGWIIE